MEKDPNRSRDWEHLSDFSVWEPPSQSVPESPIEALLRAGIGEEPERSSVEEDAELREAIEAELDELDPFERELIEAIVVERAPLRELGRRYDMHHVTVWNVKEQILDTLRTRLIQWPVIRERIGELDDR